MSEKCDAQPQIRLSKEAEEAIERAQKRRGNPKPSRNAMANALIVNGELAEAKRGK